MKLSYVELKQYSDELHSSYKNIQEILANVSEIKDRISRGECWSGTAADYYINKISALSETFEEVAVELEKSALYLDKILEGYESIDKKIMGIFGIN